MKVLKTNFILKNFNFKRFFLNQNIFFISNKTFINEKINFLNIARKGFCDWTRITIPFDKIDVSYCRSSGPGGQNVNKLNTKVEYRFNMDTCDWLPKESKIRLRELNPNKINSDGFFILTCQEFRTQLQNKKEGQKKLQELIDIASMPVHERIIVPFVESAHLEEKRIKEKKMRSDVKKMRNGRDF